MNVDVSIFGGRLFVRFPYDPNYVERIKTEALGLGWDKANKAWTSNGLEPLLDFERAGIRYRPQDEYTRRAILDWFQQLNDVIVAKTTDFGDEPYAFQRFGTDALVASRRAILADPMGLGKSKQAIDAARKAEADRVLVLAPKTLLYNWEQEVRTWWPEIDTYVVPDNRANRARLFLDVPSSAVVIANYEKIRGDDWPFAQDWDVLILDEATVIKNTRTQVHKKVLRIIDRADHTYALTGTPMEKDIEELYALISAIRPAVFGNWYRFSRQHVTFDFWDKPVGVKNLPLLRERVGLWFIRRNKADVLKNLPPKLPPVAWTFPLDDYERARYQEIKRGVYIPPGAESAEPMDPMVRILRAQQLTSSPDLLYDGAPKGSKFAELQRIICDWDGEHVLVFTRFREMAERLREWLELPELAIITGAVDDSQERLRRVDAFNRGELGQVFIGTDAMAYGLNITSANLVIHYDRLWNPAKEWQREDRAHRIGQSNPVHVLYLLAERSIDMGMHETVMGRAEEFKDVVEGTEEQFELRFGRRGKLQDVDADVLMEGQKVA